MNRRSLFVLLLIVSATLSIPCHSWAISGMVNRPFRGLADGMIVAPIPPNGLALEASGVATHLGRFARAETIYLNPDGTFQGNIVFSAANGDLLNCHVSGAFISANDAVGNYLITGGTGRFANATGEAAFSAHTPDGIHVAASFNGWISY